MAQANKSIRVPKRIGNYEVKDAIGRGAMGEVFLAEHEHLARNVALKRRISSAAESAKDQDEAKERFTREGRTLAKLNHHAIVSIHDFFTWRGDMYMALEYVDGIDLFDLLKNGPLPWEVATIVGIRIAEALEYAHFHRVVHRDIKPGNVLISRTGDVKLSDFGIARDDAETESALTQTGMVVGTPVYLAPEVLTGEKAGPRSDLYAVGAVLYQCVAGRRMFEGVQGDALIAQILSGRFPKLSKVAPHDLPKPLVRLISRLIERKPERRHPTASALRDDLEAFLRDRKCDPNFARTLLSYLQSVGKVSAKETDTYLNASELIIDDTIYRGAIGTSRKWIALAVAGIFGGAIYWFGRTFGFDLILGIFRSAGER